jgi:hypothetical protein
MKKTLLKTFFTGLLGMAALNGYSQAYVKEMYQTSKISNVVYDSTRSVNILYGQVPGAQPIIGANLQCDIYHPINAETKRPLVILAHTGSFLPVLTNQQATGSKNDSAIVEMSTRLAKMGYVVAAINYRLGWNAATTVNAVATEQLLQATYRGVQDIRNAIRFMRSNAAAYGIDTSKIVVGGQGTGGYIALAFGTIDKKSEIEDVAKFQRGDFTPMVNVDTLGDWYGLGGKPEFVVAGDADIASNAHMVFNYGGALGHLPWLEANSLPVVGMHVTTDPFAPYKTSNVIVPTTGATVIPNASGAGDVIPKANELGVNAKINAKNLLDPYTQAALSRSNGVNNLYPFHTAFPLDGAPWEWWDRASVQAKVSTSFYHLTLPANGMTGDTLAIKTNPQMSAAKGRSYIDTVINFIAPRIAMQLDLVPAAYDTLKESFNLTAGQPLILIKGDGALTVPFNWGVANKTGFGNMTYTLKFSKADAVDFSAPVGEVVGNAYTNVNATFSTIANMMADMGIAIEDTAKLKWTVEADLNGTKLWASDTLDINFIYGQVTGVKEVAHVNQYLSVYPNPASDVLNINIDNKAGTVNSYRVIDITGRVVAESNANSNSFAIDVNGVNPGLYFVQVILNNGNVATKRVVIK